MSQWWTPRDFIWLGPARRDPATLTRPDRSTNDSSSEISCSLGYSDTQNQLVHVRWFCWLHPRVTGTFIGGIFLAKLSSIPSSDWHDISFNLQPIDSIRVSYSNMSNNSFVRITLYVICKLVQSLDMCPNIWHLSWNVSRPLLFCLRNETKKFTF